MAPRSRPKYNRFARETVSQFRGAACSADRLTASRGVYPPVHAVALRCAAIETRSHEQGRGSAPPTTSSWRGGAQSIPESIKQALGTPLPAQRGASSPALTAAMDELRRRNVDVADADA
jgi:hypothetical protein